MQKDNLKKKLTIIHSKRLAAYLMLKGFVLKALQTNLANSNYNVYIFSYSEALEQAMINYKEDKLFQQYADELKYK